MSQHRLDAAGAVLEAGDSGCVFGPQLHDDAWVVVIWPASHSAGFDPDLNEAVVGGKTEHVAGRLRGCWCGLGWGGGHRVVVGVVGWSERVLGRG